MKRIKPLVLLISLSMAIIPVWGLFLLNPDTSSQFTVFTAYLITFLILNYAIQRIQPSSLVIKSLILAGPIFYLLASIVVIQDIPALLTFPIVWIFVFSLIIFWMIYAKMLFRFMVTISFASLYAFAIYPKTEFAKTQTFDFERIESELSTNHTLSDFSFLNSQMDSVVLTQLNKPILIETWNETCGPCIQSIRDLQEILAKDTSFHHVYLYQYRGKKHLDANTIFNYEEIKSSEKILIDIDNKLFETLQLNSYPYFLVYDREGRLRSYHSGYNRKKKGEVLKKLNGLIQSATLIL